MRTKKLFIVRTHPGKKFKLYIGALEGEWDGDRVLKEIERFRREKLDQEPDR